MKSCTDLEQSKKLAEILPLESADMYFTGHQSIVKPKEWEYENVPKIKDKYISFDDKRIFYPCWSLAALLSVLPRFIKFEGDKYYLGFMKEYVEYANDEKFITGRCLHTTGNDNLVNACYEMVLKLHELKML